MAQWTARIRTTHHTVATVEADTREDAIRAFKNPGKWIYERQDELVDWDDPTDVQCDDEPRAPKKARTK